MTLSIFHNIKTPRVLFGINTPSWHSLEENPDSENPDSENPDSENPDVGNGGEGPANPTNRQLAGLNNSTPENANDEQHEDPDENSEDFNEEDPEEFANKEEKNNQEEGASPETVRRKEAAQTTQDTRDALKLLPDSNDFWPPSYADASRTLDSSDAGSAAKVEGGGKTNRV